MPHSRGRDNYRPEDYASLPRVPQPLIPTASRSPPQPQRSLAPSYSPTHTLFSKGYTSPAPRQPHPDPAAGATRSTQTVYPPKGGKAVMVVEHVSGDIQRLEDPLMLKLCNWDNAHGSGSAPYTMIHGRSTSQFWSYCGDPRLRFVTVGFEGGIPMHYGHFKYGSTHAIVVQAREGYSWQNNKTYFVTPAAVDEFNDTYTWHVWSRKRLKLIPAEYRVLSIFNTTIADYAAELRSSLDLSKAEEGEIVEEKSIVVNKPVSYIKHGVAPVEAINKLLLRRAATDEDHLSKSSSLRAPSQTSTNARSDSTAGILGHQQATDNGRWAASTRATTVELVSAVPILPQVSSKRRLSSWTSGSCDGLEGAKKVKLEQEVDEYLSTVPNFERPSTSDHSKPYPSAQNHLPSRASLTSPPPQEAIRTVWFHDSQDHAIRDRPFSLCDSARKLFAQAQVAKIINRDTMILRIVCGGQESFVCRDDERNFDNVHGTIITTGAVDILVSNGD